MIEQVFKSSRNSQVSSVPVLYRTSKVNRYSLTLFIDQFKPYVCSFSSIFTLYHLLDSKLPPKDLAAEYCSQLSNVELSKLELIISLASMTLDSMFKDKCMHKVSQYSELYSWMDPMLITNDISVGTLCENLGDLYKDLKE